MKSIVPSEVVHKARIEYRDGHKPDTDKTVCGKRQGLDRRVVNWALVNCPDCRALANEPLPPLEPEPPTDNDEAQP